MTFKQPRICFSECLKQEPSDLVTGDIASLFLDTTEGDINVTDPLV